MTLVRSARIGVLSLCALFIAALGAMRGGWADSSPALLAALGAGIVAASAAGSVGLVVDALRSRRLRAVGAAEGAVFLGLLVAAGGGFANWALGFQGVGVLTEGEVLPLDHGQHLQAYSAGPLARSSELAGAIRLEKVRLTPEGDGFAPESTVQYQGPDGVSRDVALSPGRGAAFGRFALQQGAFGFSPRIVIQKDGVTLLDRNVPFTSRREGPRGVAFEGELELASHGIRVNAAVDLTGLDERMKGHPVLLVEVRHGDEILGQGPISPGHGVTVQDGWHVGYGGMKMWSEIDIVRRSHRLPVLLGFAIVVVAALAWLLAAWRRW